MAIPPPLPSQRPLILTTTDTIPQAVGCRVLGLVRGTSVRALGIKGGLTPTFQGGEIPNLVDFYTGTQEQAERMMIDQAINLGATAIVGVRYEVSATSAALYSILCYGTAIVTTPELEKSQNI